MLFFPHEYHHLQKKEESLRIECRVEHACKNDYVYVHLKNMKNKTKAKYMYIVRECFRQQHHLAAVFHDRYNLYDDSDDHYLVHYCESTLLDTYSLVVRLR